MTVRGASADALAELTDRLDDVRGNADGAKVGEDLFAIASVLRSEPGFRRVATDVSTDPEAKAGLVRSIFEGKVEQASLDLAAEAVRRRWTASRDLADALEHLGVVAVVRSTSARDAKRLSDELFTVRQLVEGDHGLRDALSDPARSVDDKRALLRELLDQQALPATVRLAEQSLSGSYRSPGVALAEYEKVAAAVHDEHVAEVRTAQALTDTELRRLQDALSRQYARQIHLNVVVEPELLGGLRIEIGDDVIDGTVAARLDGARRKLAG
jgi:F-type H+-transporting ATPase subunit delta